MKNILLLSLCCLVTFASFAQVPPANQVRASKKGDARSGKPAASRTIRGEIVGKTVIEDSIFFVAGRIDPKYFEGPRPAAKIQNNTFLLATTVPYPQLRRILLQSDKGRRIYRKGAYFLDASTRTMRLDYQAEECQQVEGTTAAEYRNSFIPFFTKARADADCHQRSFDELAWDEASRYDSTLQAYVQTHPASYVALWSLIERFSAFGHSELRESTLALFSASVQASRPWQLAQQDMRQALIKQGAVFPSFRVAGVSQPAQQLQLPKAKYTLVDFWFCRCRPCIESFPALKKLYATYQPQGFEVVSISTDKTAEVPLWQKRIKEYELPWVQYLDENAVAATQLAVYSFPTTFLLDQTGKVVQRNITPEELEKFLAEKLGK
ncbi:TlpA disulfide reductase family protein [Hymenobacter sp. YC55]|uniref:TlpA family protein disulfide reductase n=1 Tax=Hymenobacter sp. YC55 TaxID=3034019 RepID=UPI0023F99E34|nr:TlpA disulfide reductase family protein [Hymenobacter sp. YC55]MDF7815225.1 TlpA disulfide reductase family protein [Hymenobacter sp. YC55]